MLNISIKTSPAIKNMDKNTLKAIKKAVVVARDKTMAEIRDLSAGESFVDRTGTLRRSILADKKLQDRGLTASVTANAGYAGHVNDGTKYITARKYMERGLEKASTKFEGYVIHELNKAL